MQILNYRQGFATNSSSTHSVVLSNSAWGSAGEWEFGWDDFVQKTKEEKLAYMARTLAHALEDVMDTTTAQTAIQNLLGVHIPTNEYGFEGYVDHQSLITCPRLFDGKKLAVEFFVEASKYLAQDTSVAIQGGNDNDDRSSGTPHPNWAWLANLNDRAPATVRKNKDGIWTLFDRCNGTKVNLTFDSTANTAVLSNYRPAFPELIDVKITDYCAAGCSYCYQGSTKHGIHAPLDQIKQLALLCSSREVFEVALGGGEPTEHPDFAQILRAFHDNKVVVNFTTKSIDWFNDKTKRIAVEAYCGGLAFSAESAEDVLKCKEFSSKLEGPKVSIQCIPDLMSRAQFIALLRAAQENWMPVTLLGFKPTGRSAGSKPPHSHPDWMSLVLEYAPRLTVGIDTKLAQDYPTALHNVDKRIYYTEEGRYSMYIDLVKNLYGPSSYMPEKMRAGYSHDALKAFELGFN